MEKTKTDIVQHENTHAFKESRHILKNVKSDRYEKGK